MIIGACYYITAILPAFPHPTKVVDAGNAVRAELREHEQALLEEEAIKTEEDTRLQLQAHLVRTLTVPL